MIRKRYILIPLVVIIAVLIVCVLGYKQFLSKNNASEMIFAATETGTPQGEKITKEIGPAGGTLASPDGRLTLTVPPNALTETIPFSIQPITNKAESGLGLAYRLEQQWNRRRCNAIRWWQCSSDPYAADGERVRRRMIHISDLY